MKILFAVMFIFLLVFTACDEIDNKDSTDGDFFQGSQGVRMEIQRDAPPYKVFWFPTEYLGEDPRANSFPIIIELDNEGTSDTLGFISVSGYNPDFIEVEGMNPRGNWAECWWTNFNYFKSPGASVINQLRISFGCSDRSMFIWNNEEDWFVDVGEISRQTGWFEDIFSRMDLQFGEYAGDEYGYIDINLNNADFNNLIYGRLLVSQARGFDLDRNSGVSYDLIGDRPDFPGGETEFMALDVTVWDFPLGTDYLDQDFLITNCYLYATDSTPQVCIDPRPSNNDRKVCRGGEVRQRSSQGAPVSLTVKDVQNTPRGIIFTIEGRNVGRGDVISPLAFTRCSPYHPSRLITGKDLNVIELGFVYIGNRPVTCNSNFIKLNPSGVGRVTCQYFPNGANTVSAYETPITIEGWYAYRETKIRTVRIQRAG